MAINHQHGPLDIGNMQVTGINESAYKKPRKAYGLSEKEIVLCDSIQGLALPDEDFIKLTGIDVRGLFLLNAYN